MVERLGHPVPPEPGLEQSGPLVPGEYPELPRPHDPRPPEPGEAKREVELRPIAEDLITALESEDRELKIKAVVGVLSRFELKKPPVDPRPGHPRPPVPGEHPERPRPPHPRP